MNKHKEQFEKLCMNNKEKCKDSQLQTKKKNMKL